MKWLLVEWVPLNPNLKVGENERSWAFNAYIIRIQHLNLASGILIGPSGLTILSAAELLVIFGELDTPEAVKANGRAIRQIMDQPGRGTVERGEPSVQIQKSWLASESHSETFQTIIRWRCHRC